MGRRDGKTEKASPRRRSEARKEGQIARSQEVAVAATLLAITVALRLFAVDGFTSLSRETTAIFGNLPTDVAGMGAVTPALLRIGFGVLGPFVVIGFVVAFASQVVQVGFSVKPKAAKPSLKKLSPKQGLSRLKPSKAGWELVRTIIKLGLLAAVVAGPLRAWMDELSEAWNMESALAGTGRMVTTVLLRASVLAAIVALLDYLWNRRSTERDLRMSKDDVRREHKNSEGDPQVKGRRRQRAMEMSRGRMMLDVALADVVVTNPTHLAVALQYSAGSPAPKVVAKGADHLAARIRREAYHHGVQVIEDKPVARALYKGVKVGGYVPGALFEAVAVILATAYRRYGRVIA